MTQPSDPFSVATVERADALLDQLLIRARAHRYKCQNGPELKCTGEEVDAAVYELPRVTAKTLLRLAIWRIVQHEVAEPGGGAL